MNTSSGAFGLTASIDADTFRPTNKELHIAETGFETVKIYPNPASDVLHISGIEKGSVIALYDLRGSIILQTTATETSYDMAITHLSQGAYRLQIRKKDGTEGGTTIVKQ